MDLTGKPFEASDPKKKNKEQKKDSRPCTKKIVERKDSESNKLTFPLQTVRFKLNKTSKQSIHIKTVWNFAKLELRSQVLTFSTLM